MEFNTNYSEEPDFTRLKDPDAPTPDDSDDDLSPMDADMFNRTAASMIVFFLEICIDPS